MKWRVWMFIPSVLVLFFAASTVLQFYPSVPDLIGAAGRLACAVWNSATEFLDSWQPLIGGALAAVAVAWVAVVTLSAEKRHRKQDEDDTRRHLAKVLRFEIKGVLEIIGRAQSDVTRSFGSRDEDGIHMPPLHLPLLTFDQNVMSLALLDGDLLGQLMRFHNGLWAYPHYCDRLNGIRPLRRGVASREICYDFLDWVTYAHRIGRHLDEVHLLRLEQDKPPIEWGEPFGNWPAESDERIAKLATERT